MTGTLLEPTADPIRFEEITAGRTALEGHQVPARMVGAPGLAGAWPDNTHEPI